MHMNAQAAAPPLEANAPAVKANAAEFVKAKRPEPVPAAEPGEPGFLAAL